MSKEFQIEIEGPEIKKMISALKECAHSLLGNANSMKRPKAIELYQNICDFEDKLQHIFSQNQGSDSVDMDDPVQVALSNLPLRELECRGLRLTIRILRQCEDTNQVSKS